MVQFRPINLLNDFSALGTFDVVFCRNVLIYFDQDTKIAVLDRIARQMPDDGYLVLGAAETVIGLTGAFKPLADKRGLYVPTSGTKQPARGADNVIRLAAVKGLEPSAKRGAEKIKLPAGLRRRLDLRTNHVDYRRRAGAPLLSARVGVAARDHGQCGLKGMIDLGRLCRSGAGR